MRKIRLDLDALAVETFATTKDGEAERGTVRGNGSGLGCGTADCGGEGLLDHSISAYEGCICRLNDTLPDWCYGVTLVAGCL